MYYPSYPVDPYYMQNAFKSAMTAQPTAQAVSPIVAHEGPATMMGPGLSAGDQMGQFLTSPLGMAGSALSLLGTDWGSSESIGSTAGGIGGAALGSLIPIPGVGSLIGATAGSELGKLTGGLFGKTEKQKAKEKQKKAQRMQWLDNLVQQTMQQSQGTRSAIDSITRYLQSGNQARGSLYGGGAM